jgi:threonine dehydrogenase-like Zn-dependent dehydrogenase
LPEPIRTGKTQRWKDLTTHGPIFDVVIDAVGKYAYHWGRRALKPGGIYTRAGDGRDRWAGLIEVSTPISGRTSWRRSS